MIKKSRQFKTLERASRLCRIVRSKDLSHSVAREAHRCFAPADATPASASLQVAPTVFLLPANQAACNDWAKFYIPAAGDTNAPDTTKFSIHIGTALSDGTSYKFRYLILENNA